MELFKCEGRKETEIKTRGRGVLGARRREQEVAPHTWTLGVASCPSTLLARVALSGWVCPGDSDWGQKTATIVSKHGKPCPAQLLGSRVSEMTGRVS